MEKEIHHMFTYGELQHLGSDGYKEFIQMRRSIKAKREKMIYEQMRRRQEFARKVKDYTLALLLLIPSTILIYHIISIIYTAGVSAGKW
jgi:hypothetical protein